MRNRGSTPENATQLKVYAGYIHFHYANPCDVTIHTWIWAARNGFKDLRKFAYNRCKREIYQAMGEAGGIDNLEREGVPSAVLKQLLERAARLMGDRC